MVYSILRLESLFSATSFVRTRDFIVRRRRCRCSFAILCSLLRLYVVQQVAILMEQDTIISYEVGRIFHWLEIRQSEA